MQRWLCRKGPDGQARLYLFCPLAAFEPHLCRLRCDCPHLTLAVFHECELVCRMCFACCSTVCIARLHVLSLSLLSANYRFSFKSALRSSRKRLLRIIYQTRSPKKHRPSRACIASDECHPSTTELDLVVNLYFSDKSRLTLLP